MSKLHLTMLALGAAFLLAGPYDPARAQGKAQKAEARALPGLDSVLPELLKGGLVIYFRHAATDVSSGATDEKSDLARCETQRNLSAAGRQQATSIGLALRTLGVPIGSVLASPFCRCRDTAQLAFGRHVVDRDLYFAIGVDATERARLAQALKRLLSTPMPRGMNNVLVSHTANLQEAAGIWPRREGSAYVFRPLANGRFEPLALIQPEDWSRAAGLPAPEAKK